MPLEPKDRDRIIEKLAMNDDFEPAELALMVREETGTPCTEDEIKEFVEKDETQERIENKRGYMEKNADYTRQQLINEMKGAKEVISSMMEELQDQNKSRSMVEAAGELRKTLELLGKTIDAVQDSEAGGDQYIRIDELSVDIIADVLDEDDVEAIVKQHDGLRVKHKRKGS